MTLLEPENSLVISGGYYYNYFVYLLTLNFVFLHSSLQHDRRIGEWKRGRRKKRAIKFLTISTHENSETRRICNSRSTAHFIITFFCFSGQTPNPEPTPAPEDSRCFLIF